MKRGARILGALGVLVFLLLLTMVFSSCDNGGGGAYYVRFSLDGTDYELTGGYTDDNVFDDGANGARLESSDAVRIAAVDPSVTDMDTQGPLIFLRISGTAPDSYDKGTASISIATGGTGTEYGDNSGSTLSVELVTYPAQVGGTIEGTFSGLVNQTDGGPTVILAEGYFRVERLADGSIAAPGRFS